MHFFSLLIADMTSLSIAFKTSHVSLLMSFELYKNVYILGLVRQKTRKVLKIADLSIEWEEKIATFLTI